MHGVIPARIDRFTIERPIGAGAQGTVLLAVDERLSRRVVLKLLRPNGAILDDGQLENEARISSQLQHPNLVTLYEVGSYHNLRYLVFEFIDGESLKDRLQREGKLTQLDAVTLTSRLLAGVACLHRQRIVHRDLSPANILLTGDGIPKISDFGLSTDHREVVPSGEISGTLHYMSPEPFLGDPLGPHSDVFTLGVIFYEMLTGTRLMQGTNRAAIINNIVHGHADAATEALTCDATVERVINKALQRPVALRYRSALEMKTELDTFRIPRGGSGRRRAASHSTVDFLIRRMRHKKGFSALSGHISEVLELTAEQSGASASRIANILAKDITLSQRVLTAANSAFYGNTEITALPRALILLGFEQVRMCVTKALIENQFTAGAPALHDALIRSFFSAVLAKTMVHKTGFRRTADAFTCAMFHDLGRTLTIHYFADEYQTILGRVAAQASDELTASREILGIPYHELGAAVARIWKFPENIVQAMAPLPRGELSPSVDDDAHLVFVAAFANVLCNAALAADVEAANEAVIKLVARGQAVWDLRPGQLEAAFDEANRLSRNYAQLIKVAPDDQPSLQRLARPLTFIAEPGAGTPTEASAARSEPVLVSSLA